MLSPLLHLESARLQEQAVPSQLSQVYSGALRQWIQFPFPDAAQAGKGNEGSQV